MSIKFGLNAVTVVHDAETGEEIEVPVGEGLARPDRDNIYRHLWSDNRYYKFPEKPETTFKNIVSTDKMFLSKLSALPVSEQIRAINNEKNAMAVTEDLVRFCLAAGVTPFLHGPPGHAKTAFTESLGDERDENGVHYNVESEELGQVDATIINGIAYVDPSDYVMRRSVPDTAKSILNAYRETGALTIYLMDEITLAGSGQQGAALRTVTHGQMGSVVVKDYCQIMIAGNPKITVRGANDILASAINRGAHFAWIMSEDVWEHRWRRGFVADDAPRDPSREPDMFNKKLVRAMLKNPPRGISWFGNSHSASSEEKVWTKENLLPKTIEGTPRTLDYFMRVVPFVRETCDELSLSTEIRNVMLYKLALSMFSTQKAESVSTALLEIDSMFGGFDEIDSRLSDVSFADEEIPDYVETSLLLKPDSTNIGTAELSSVLDEAKSLVVKSSAHASDVERGLVVAWSCAVCADATRSSDVPMVMETIADMAQFLMNNRDILERIPGGKVSPPFVSDTLKQKLRETLSARS